MKKDHEDDIDKIIEDINELEPEISKDENVLPV